MDANVDEKTRLKGIGFEAVWERTFERTEVLVDCEDVVTEVARGGKGLTAFRAEGEAI